MAAKADKGRDAPTPDAAAEAVLDTLAGLLRTLGEHAFDTGEIDKESAKRDFEAWARHALLGTPPPGSGGSGEPGRERDWAGLRRFVSGHRRSESESVQRSLSNLGETLWIFIQGIGRALPAERASDEAVGAQLDELRGAIDTGDLERIRASAVTAIEKIESAVEERHENSRRQIELLSARVDRFASELMEIREALELDPLTGLFDRAALDEVLERMVHLALLSGRASTLFVVDVDDFKWLNDRFGADAGDAVLADVARCISGGFNRRGDFVARAGADEFAVIVQTESAQLDESLGEHVLQSVRDLEVPVGDERIRVSVSMGAVRLAPGESVESWVARAEGNLHFAKEAGRDRLVLDGEA